VAIKARVTKAGINLNGKPVKPGQFDVVPREESDAQIKVVKAEHISNAMYDKLGAIQRLGDYKDEVFSHFGMNQVAIDVLGANPTAVEMRFSRDAAQRMSPFGLASITLEDGTEVTDFPLSPQGEGGLSDVKWGAESPLGACGRTVEGGDVVVDVADALDIPEYLKDPAFLDAPAVPSQVGGLYGRDVHTLAHVEYERRCLDAVDNESYRDSELKVLDDRAAELIAAGVTR